MHLMVIGSWLLAALAAAAFASDGPRKTVYDDLLNHLFANESQPYRVGAMPICEAGQKLHMSQDMLLLQLFELDEPTQMLTIDVWMESTWKDCRLSWDPTQFNGIDNFAIKASEIWYPDLLFYESLHGNFEEGMFVYGESTARIFSDGSVQLGAQAAIKVFCRIEISRFPYDSQRCNITFSSWTKDASTFVLTKKPSDASQTDDHVFQSASNGEWQVEGFPSFNRVSDRRVGVDEIGTGRTRSYTEVVFQLQLKRKYLFYQVYMLFPCILLTWLTLFVFLLPAECGEKMAYVTTILLSLFVFLLLISDNIPRSGDAVPLLGVYFCLAIALVSLANVKSVVSYNISLKSKDFCMPKFLQWLLQRGKYVGLRMQQHNNATKVLLFAMRTPSASRNPVGRPEESEAVQLQQLDRGADGVSDGVDGGGVAGRNSAVGDGGDEADEQLSQWRFLGIVFDRVFFILYFFTNLAVTIWILSSE